MGGADKVQAFCMIKPDALRKWREKGFVPPKHWGNAIDLSGGKVRWRELWEMVK